MVLLRPHHRNFNKRLVKSPKLYFLDTGLLCYLLRIRDAEDLRLHAQRGGIFESFVISELYKRALHNGQEPDLFFWRDSTGHEVDCIIDQGQTLAPVEIKSGATIAGDFFKGLDYWKKISGVKDQGGALIYGGDRTFRHKETIVYSWWNF